MLYAGLEFDQESDFLELLDDLKEYSERNNIETMDLIIRNGLVKETLISIFDLKLVKGHHLTIFKEDSFDEIDIQPHVERLCLRLLVRVQPTTVKDFVRIFPNLIELNPMMI